MNIENARHVAKEVKAFYANNPLRWVQNQWSNGTNTSWCAGDATCWCVGAVIWKLEEANKILSTETMDFIRIFRKLTGSPAMTYNDAETTTFESLNGALDKIIAMEEVVDAD